MFKHIHHDIQQIKQRSPLILNLTNDVTMEWIANGLLSLGASPIMTGSLHELEELVQIAHGVVINIGTLDDPFIARCMAACTLANRFNKPLILDPVGVGASTYRTRTGLRFLEQFKFTTLRGNASEIMALAGTHADTKGVDSSKTSLQAIESARHLSSMYQTTVAISGETDVIITNQQTHQLSRGAPRMTQVTGTGCLLTAVVAAFNAVRSEPHAATTHALLFYSVCGEIAAQKSQGPGSFSSHFLDELSFLPLRQHYE